MDNATETVVTIVTAVIGVAILAVIVSRNSRTSEVIQSAASGFGSVLGVAVSPITGNTPNLAYPGGFGSFGGGFSF